jgi:sec-independent protein translocase protein TatA
MLGGWELLLILALIMLLFGGKRLPELARNLGHGLREFKRATNEVHPDTILEEKPEERSNRHE